MTGDGRALHAAHDARKKAAEEAVAQLSRVRRELAERDAALRELEREREAASQRVVQAREQAAQAHDVSALRWAHDHLRALVGDHARLEERLRALRPARAELAAKLARLEHSWREAEVAQRAVGSVIQKRHEAETRRLGLAEEERADDLARALPRKPHAK